MSAPVTHSTALRTHNCASRSRDGKAQYLMQACYSSRFSCPPDATPRTGRAHPRTVAQSGLTTFAINGHFVEIDGQGVEATVLAHSRKTRLTPGRHKDTGKLENDASEHGLSPE